LQMFWERRCLPINQSGLIAFSIVPASLASPSYCFFVSRSFFAFLFPVVFLGVRSPLPVHLPLSAWWERWSWCYWFDWFFYLV
jgi:hypothetical protein